ncbi:MAG: M20/M25/M40 family metallo-hydrolase, partial [Nitrospirae bacterium]|nr:M20/M25/M40 family metallo-hydrolase [Nitrospirota bacterium]
GCRVAMQHYGESFNLIASKEGAVRSISPLILSAHMDTIEPTEGIRFAVESGLIRTTGQTVLGADDKSAIAQIIEALFVLQETGAPHGDLEIIFSSAEETGLLGARNLDFTGLRGKHALVLDSSGSVGRLVIAAPTHITYEMRISGKSAHAGLEPESGISAIRVASRIISEIPDGRIDPETTSNVGIIRGGTATNVVPQEVFIKGEIRGHSAEILEQTKKIIFGTAREIAERCNAQIHITEREEYVAYRVDLESPFLFYMGGVLTKCSLSPVYTVTGGGSDANILNQNGIQAINMSNGMQKVHSTEEFIRIKDLHDGCMVVLNAVANFESFKEVV